MARLAGLPFLLLSLLVAATAHSSGGAGEGAVPLSWIPRLSTCQGTIAECLGGEEFDLSSEVARRILADSNYVSYNALKQDSVPCSRRGASYYNCQPGAEANPYSRGCSAITQCRS
ncbi:rapid alkalinization factor-like [Elaeis guineensis]|uniref:Rapid alkalinization factor-like n=1 Tax=Elaeis guineensis var. tenera TaxID=51953 RepID=A0A6I9S183_ELAGV|nr:rapid alkalinization factor-like [Elaeis guineensis]